MAFVLTMGDVNRFREGTGGELFGLIPREYSSAGSSGWDRSASKGTGSCEC